MAKVAAGLVPVEAVEAALDAARESGRDVADVPIALIAAKCGMSRSTLLRRLGGSRGALDRAVQARGVDPGGAPVKVRAVDAAAALIGESGLAAATLETIARRADCAVASLYAVFGTRDGLFREVFERHSSIREFEEFFARPHDDLRDTIAEFYTVVAQTMTREPRVLPAMLAEAFARPGGAAVQALFGHAVPRMVLLVGGWLSAEVSAGRIRDLPIMLLMQQLMAPMVVHLMARPIADSAIGAAMPTVDIACETFADAFVNAVGIAPR